MKVKKNSTMQKGFTLVELMIVVAIIGILAAFAYNSYQKYVLRSHRVDARNMLQEIQQKLEANYTLTHAYNEMSDETEIEDSTLQTWGLNQSPINGTTAYEISFSEGPTDSSYTLKAVAVNTQVNDICQTISLNNYNVKTANGLTSRDDTSRECWSK